MITNILIITKQEIAEKVIVHTREYIALNERN